MITTRREPLRITGPLLVVSPHFDDVALSCEALIARSEPMTVLRVCTAVPRPAVVTEWDRDSGFADSDIAVAARQAEEQAAFAGTAHRFADAGVLDLQYSPVPRPDTDHRCIADAVGAWVNEAGGRCTVAVPVGAGRKEHGLVPLTRLRNLVTKALLSSMHPDHLLVRDAALHAVRTNPDVDVVLYEELPYRLTTRGNAAARRVRATFGAGTRLVCSDIPIDTASKARRLRAYGSQLPQLFPARALADDVAFARFLPARERYWRLARR